MDKNEMVNITIHAPQPRIGWVEKGKESFGRLIITVAVGYWLYLLLLVTWGDVPTYCGTVVC